MTAKNEITPEIKVGLKHSKMENIDDTNLMYEKRKILYSRKQDMMKLLHPYVVKDQLSNEEYKHFFKPISEQSLGFPRYL